MFRVTKIAGMLLASMSLGTLPAWGDGTIVEQRYEPSETPGELVYGVMYRLWIPEGVETLRGLIVHQHGCGKGACEGGRTAADDLHWQALARKWDCALLGPSFEQEDEQNCRLWCDPRNGSRARFLQALEDLAEKSGHPEVATVPWCLWGHSGGGFWASLMQCSDPDRIVAIWMRSGTAHSTWTKGEIPAPEVPEAAYKIPVMCNPGSKEKGDERFNGAWTGAMAMFEAYRQEGAPIGLAPDPKTAHECGDSRYLAIPYFDACLAARLPEEGSNEQTLKTVDETNGWLADALGGQAVPHSDYKGDSKSAVWLPNEAVAKLWEAYVTSGEVPDVSAPESPFDVRARIVDGSNVELTWDAHADLESGLRGFIVLRDGTEVARLPDKAVGRFGRPLFQGMSYHDTPEAPVAGMRIRLDGGEGAAGAQFQVVAVNGVGLESEPSEGVRAEKE